MQRFSSDNEEEEEEVKKDDVMTFTNSVPELLPSTLPTNSLSSHDVSVLNSSQDSVTASQDSTPALSSQETTPALSASSQDTMNITEDLLPSRDVTRLDLTLGVKELERKFSEQITQSTEALVAKMRDANIEVEDVTQNNALDVTQNTALDVTQVAELQGGNNNTTAADLSSGVTVDHDTSHMTYITHNQSTMLQHLDLSSLNNISRVECPRFIPKLPTTTIVLDEKPTIKTPTLLTSSETVFFAEETERRRSSFTPDQSRKRHSSDLPASSKRASGEDHSTTVLHSPPTNRISPSDTRRSAVLLSPPAVSRQFLDTTNTVPELTSLTKWLSRITDSPGAAPGTPMSYPELVKQ